MCKLQVQIFIKMRKTILSLLLLTGLFSTYKANSQTFSVPTDTVYATVAGTASITNNITNLTSGSLTIKWKVIATNFPADWLTAAAFGICDACGCSNNLGDTSIWNATTSTGTLFNCDYAGPSGAVGLYSLSLNLSGVSAGTHYMTVNINSGLGGTSKNVTFIISKFPAIVNNVFPSTDDIKLYPNPANEDINVVFDANADIKNIAIYNIIGKVMSIYKVTGNSANLTLDGIPAGIYFVRLYNSHGDVVVTRKFTKQ